MSSLSLSIPQNGLPRSTEEPKVANDLTAIQTWANGNIDSSNLSPTSGYTRSSYRLMSSSATAASGDWVNATHGITVALPVPALNSHVTITADGFTSGTSQVTVTGTNIYGLGLIAASSFKLGAPLATVQLISDGTNWVVTSGTQDTGWVTIPLTSGVTAGGLNFTPAARLRGDTVHLSGVAVVSSGSPASFGTIPSGMRPPSLKGIGFLAALSSADNVGTLRIDNTGAITTDLTLAVGDEALFDSLSYRIS